MKSTNGGGVVVVVGGGVSGGASQGAHESFSCPSPLDTPMCSKAGKPELHGSDQLNTQPNQ